LAPVFQVWISIVLAFFCIDGLFVHEIHNPLGPLLPHGSRNALKIAIVEEIARPTLIFCKISFSTSKPHNDEPITSNPHNHQPKFVREPAAEGFAGLWHLQTHV
jgi:hypothetical protein